MSWRKMNYLLKCFLILLVNLILSKSLFADEKRFLCKTEHFLDSSTVFEINKKDKEFESRSRSREFLLEIFEENIELTDVFPERRSPESYQIIMRVTNTKDVMAVTVNPIGVRTLVFNPIDKIGTKTFQGSSFTYVFYLRCM